DGKSGIASDSQSTQSEEPLIDVEPRTEERRDDAASVSDRLSVDDDEEDARLNLGDAAGELMEQRQGTQKTAANIGGFALPGLQFGDEFPVLLLNDDADGDKETDEADGTGENCEWEQAEPTDRERLRSFDEGFPAKLAEFDTAIDTASLALDQLRLAVFASQSQRLGVLEKDGRSAGRAGEDTPAHTDDNPENGDRPGGDKSGVDNAELQTTLERSPEKLISLQANRAVFLISSGQDENIQKGELELARLVEQCPSLHLNQGFRDLVVAGYGEMSAARESRGLEPWSTKLTPDDVRGKAQGAPPEEPAEEPRRMLEKATAVFFEQGINAASPHFQKAIEAQNRVVQAGDRERMRLFIEGLSQDAQIANRTRKGEEVDGLIAERAEHTAGEQEYATQFLDAQTQATSFRVNFDFARIASGDAAQLKDASSDLEQMLKSDPSLLFEQNFRDNLQNAYKAHAQNAPQIDSTAGGTTRTPGGNDSAETKPVYGDLDLSSTYRAKEIDDEQDQGSYLADKATNFTLTAVALGLAAAQVSRTIRSYHSANITNEAVQAAAEVRPFEGVRQGTTVERSAGEEPVANFEIKGEVRDGRVLLSRTASEGARTEGAADAEFKTIEPGKEFSPGKGQYGEYTPVESNGERMYADREGRVFKYSAGGLLSRARLFENADTRRLSVVPRSEVASVIPELTVDPRAAEITSEHPEKALPPAWQREFDFLRNVKASVVDTREHISRRMESLDRAMKRLGQLADVERAKYFEELTRQLKQVGIDVTTSNPSGQSGHTAETTLYLSVPGSSERVAISSTKPPQLQVLDETGAVSSTKDGVVEVADAFRRMDKAVTRTLTDPAVRDGIISGDPELTTDASTQQLRSSLLDSVPQSWRQPVLEERLRASGHMESIERLRTATGAEAYRAITDVLMSDNPAEGLELMRETGVLKRVLPEVDALIGLEQDVRAHPENDTFDHIKRVVQQASRMAGLDAGQRRALMWGALLHDIGMPATRESTEVDGEPPRVTFRQHDRVGGRMAEEVLNRLEVPAGERALVVDITAEHMNMHQGLKDSRVEALVNKHGAKNMVLFRMLQEADSLGRDVHTLEQWESLKLSEQGLPRPVNERGEPLSA
ncbi:MAG: HD domain-containing protein, partial [Cyanobacteria bacterium]|nr:HD domain-containing protein [Cyanobacteriota bacterium]